MWLYGQQGQLQVEGYGSVSPLSRNAESSSSCTCLMSAVKPKKADPSQEPVGE